MPPRTVITNRLIAALIVLVGLGAAITIVVSDDDGNGRPDRIVIELHGQDDQPAGVPAGPETLTLEEPAVAALEGAKRGDLGDHDDLVNERPPGADTGELEAATLQQAELAKRADLPDATPLAAPFQRGCRTRLVGNYSSRAGVPPRVFVMHYTVSRNRPGFADVDGITAYFNGRGSSASSHYVIDREGNCNYIVRETSKAWTQAAGNPVSIAVEVIAYGDEPDLLGPGGYRKVGLVYADAARRWRIPLQRGRVSGCRVVRAGIIDHRAFGSCGGGHHDVGPFEPRNRALDRILAAARAATGSRSSTPKAIRRWCHHVTEHRARERRGATTAAQRAHARRHLRDLKRRGWACGRDGKATKT